MPLPDELRPTPLEIACGTVFGWSPPEPLPDVPPSLTPLAALEEALVPALERGHCFVAFSGGRDSSAVLAAATHAARRRGLADPIPLTMRFPHAAGTDERDWQEAVVRHLRLTDWERLHLGDELDMLGPISRADLLRHRCPWPANGHSFALMYATARHGSLVTGMDGDGLLDSWQWRRAAAVLARRRRPEPRDALRLVKAFGPRFVRRIATERRTRPFAGLSWLTEDARREATKAWSRFLAGEPARWDQRLRWYTGQRHLRVITTLMSANAGEHGAVAVHPLLDRRFLASLARSGGRYGYADRAAAIRAIFADAVPDRTVSRSTKADFTWAFWGPESRRFAEEWDGRGVDATLVDPEALREAWLAEKPDFRSACMLQAAWLESAAEAEQQVDCRAQ